MSLILYCKTQHSIFYITFICIFHNRGDVDLYSRHFLATSELYISDESALVASPVSISIFSVGLLPLPKTLARLHKHDNFNQYADTFFIKYNITSTLSKFSNIVSFLSYMFIYIRKQKKLITWPYIHICRSLGECMQKF